MAQRVTKNKGGLPILITAGTFDLWQALFVLFGFGAAGLTTLPYFIGDIIAFLGGDEVAIGFFVIATGIGLVGLMVCSLLLTLRGVKILSGNNAGKKWLAYIACFVGTLAAYINFLPFLTPWVAYIIFRAE